MRSHAFFGLWLGQFLSLLGTDATKFALRVWSYSDTGSVTQFALITVFAELPSFFLSPIGGAFSDRYNRKYIMMISDLISAMSTACLFLLHSTGSLQTWHIYLASAIGSSANAFQWPAFTSSVITLLPRDGDNKKFQGMNQAAPAISMLLAPLIGGYVVVSGGLSAVFMVELSTFLLASAMALGVTIPPPEKSTEGQEGSGSLLGEISGAWNFIRMRPGLVGMVLFLSWTQFCSGMIQVLMTPMVMNFASADVLGGVLTASGAGAVFGSIILAFYTGPKQRKVLAVLFIGLFQGCLLSLCGIYPNAFFILSVAFSYMFFVPLVRVCREAIWQSKAPQDMQGRIIGLQKMIQQLALPTASLLAGPLADQIFEPAMSKGGFLENSLGPILGSGPGRGAALLFVILGIFGIFASLLGLSYTPLRRVDVELPNLGTKTDKKN
ncbi:arabinose efflux permease family protein [Planoprotostelium fungivorum]|uniref:Arabinose efflux permease family protein n=1 Tax=Planoprotostelium fungivorum TaxID=1890364 RepID=A0A2P6NS54_9EUKA|nr:arabinose efflux permease family protein [Planoprotostelium fungivorum]